MHSGGRNEEAQTVRATGPRRQVGSRAVVWWLTTQPRLETAGEHDPDDPFFAAPPLDAEDAEPIDASDTDDILGDVLAPDEATSE